MGLVRLPASVGVPTTGGMSLAGSLGAIPCFAADAMAGRGGVAVVGRDASVSAAFRGGALVVARLLSAIAGTRGDADSFAAIPGLATTAV